MTKNVMPVTVFLFNILLLHSSDGQAQSNIPDYIRQRFQSYCNSVPREEIFIHTDKEEYISGEDLWFNTYLMSRQTFKPSSDSRIAYFEVLNFENKPVVQKRILLENGFGPGQIVLPDTLSSGTYTIRAYTNWMKNFLPYNCFLKEINIYNPYRTKLFRRVVRPVILNEASTGLLPDSSGLSLHVNNLRKDSLEIYIHTNEKFRSENNNVIYLFIQSHGIISHLSTEKTAKDITNITIPRESLNPGISQITIFDSKGPLCDRYIFSPAHEKQSYTLNMTDSFKRRNKVTLDIDIGNGLSGISGLTNLSVSVSSLTNSREIMDINDYLVFGTEFGLFPGGTIKGGKITELSPEVMDSLLLKVKSNWINWQAIFADDEQLFRYPPEKEVHWLSGKLLTANQQPAAADEYLLMSAPGREAVFQYTTTDMEGDFNFRIHIDEELKDLVLQPDILSKDQKVYVEPSFSEQYLQTEIFTDSTMKQVPSSISRQIINYQVRNIYRSPAAGAGLTPDIPPLKLRRFYGTPDFELIMKDFIRLDSMQEVFFELVPHVRLEHINSGYAISVTDPSGNKLDGSPAIMIDGVIIKDLSIIAALDPGLVEKIDVVWDTYRVGGYLFNGIINIILKTGDFSNAYLPADAIRLNQRVIDTVNSFISPDYSSAEMKNSRLADYRSTLYWNPSVKPDKEGKAKIEFWSADIKSDYIINIQGFNSEGKPVSFRKNIKVK